MAKKRKGRDAGFKRNGHRSHVSSDKRFLKNKHFRKAFSFYSEAFIKRMKNTSMASFNLRLRYTKTLQKI